MIELEYSCGCKYFHWGVNGVKLSHACTDHKITLAHDALANFGKE